MEIKNPATATALREEDIELELGLSIGGSYRRQNGMELGSETHIDAGSKEKNLSCERSSISTSFMVDSGQEQDQKTKREIHALRRQEAKKKRKEKQLKRGLCKGNFNNVYDHKNNNEVILKVINFQAEEKEVDTEEREFKKIKKEGNESDDRQVNFNLTVHQNDDMNNNIGTCYPTPCTASPVVPLPYTHTPVPYRMPANGFVYPCANLNVVPCWFTGGGGGTASSEEHVVQVQPVVGYGFVPFRATMDPEHNLGNGYESGQNCSSGDRGNRNAGSRSSKCTSSTGSDHRSSSHEGGGSSSSNYTRSHSSPSVPEQPQSNGSRAHIAVSHLTEISSANGATNNVEKLITSNSSQSSPARNKEESKSETELDPTDKCIFTPENPSNPSTESKGDIGKPPKPLTKDHTTPTPLPYMPCVSATGNGPNGKTVNGFLYRYTKTEVSIICVCHGRSFSPAEFVQHAGGTDVSHPLRHITVIPSAF